MEAYLSGAVWAVAGALIIAIGSAGKRLPRRLFKLGGWRQTTGLGLIFVFILINLIVSLPLFSPADSGRNIFSQAWLAPLVLLIGLALLSWGLWSRSTISSPGPARPAIDPSRLAEVEEFSDRLKGVTHQLISILDGLDAMVYVADLETDDVIFANRGLKQGLGFDPVGQKCGIIYGEQEGGGRDGVAELLDEKGRPGPVITWENYNHRLGRWFQNRDQAIFWADERLVRVQAAIDITERVEAEQALARSETRFRALYDNSPMAYISLDDQGLISQVNAAWLHQTGYHKQDVIGRSFSDFIHPDWVDHFKARMPGFIRSGGFKGADYQMVNRDGSVALVSLHGRVELDEKGLMSGMHLVLLDITEQIRADAQRTELEYQLRRAQKLEAVGTLAGGVAHEFNNILAAIMGFTELAMADGKAGRSSASSLDQILKATIRAKDLIARLLTFSRRVEPAKEWVDFNDQILQTVGILKRTIPKMIDIQLNLAMDLPKVSCDPGQLEQVVVNLANNARDAMPQGGQLTISTRLAPADEVLDRGKPELTSGDYVELKMADDGEGIDPGVIDNIFDPFYTSKAIGKGTGLGLAMVHGIIEGHKGRIECQSRLGRGTEFTILLPVEGPGETVQPRTMVEQVASGVVGGKETILVVDDEPALRQMAGKMLSRLGYKVLEAASGEEALAVYRGHQQPIDLVLMDISMPGMGGAKCMVELLKLDPKARIIIASGYAMNANLAEVVSGGALGFVGKPFSTAELASAIRRALEKPV